MIIPPAAEENHQKKCQEIQEKFHQPLPDTSLVMPSQEEELEAYRQERTRKALIREYLDQAGDRPVSQDEIKNFLREKGAL